MDNLLPASQESQSTSHQGGKINEEERPTTNRPGWVHRRYIIVLLISGAVFGNPKKNATKVPVVTPISSTFPLPQTDSKLIKLSSIMNNALADPTQLIQIGNNNNQVPFNQPANQ